MDKIIIGDLRLRCILGATDAERRERQDVLVQITLFADLDRAIASDRLEEGLDYRALKKRVLALVEASSFRLLEALTARIAEECTTDPRVDRAIVRVDKPGALRFARTVGVELIRRRQHRAFVALGSNLDPEQNAERAVRLLVASASVVNLSTFYRTAKLGRPDASSFVNGMIELTTRRRPRALRRLLRKIERALGRVRTEDRDADRTIDLDLVLYDELIHSSAGLVLPDPDILTRPFLAGPLFELAPDLVLPGEHAPIRDVAQALGASELHELPELTAKLRGLVHG